VSWSAELVPIPSTPAAAGKDGPTILIGLISSRARSTPMSRRWSASSAAATRAGWRMSSRRQARRRCRLCPRSTGSWSAAAWWRPASPNAAARTANAGSAGPVGGGAKAPVTAVVQPV